MEKASFQYGEVLAKLRTCPSLWITHPVKGGNRIAAHLKKGKNRECWSNTDGESTRRRRQQKSLLWGKQSSCASDSIRTPLQADPWFQTVSKIWIPRLSCTSQNQMEGTALPFWRMKQHLPPCTLLHWRPLSCVGLLPLGLEEEGKSHRHENQTGNWISAEPVFVCILPAKQNETMKHLLPA